MASAWLAGAAAGASGMAAIAGLDEAGAGAVVALDDGGGATEAADDDGGVGGAAGGSTGGGGSSPLVPGARDVRRRRWRRGARRGHRTDAEQPGRGAGRGWIRDWRRLRLMLCVGPVRYQCRGQLVEVVLVRRGWPRWHGVQIRIRLVGPGWRGTILGNLAAFLAVPPVDRTERPGIGAGAKRAQEEHAQQRHADREQTRWARTDRQHTAGESAPARRKFAGREPAARQQCCRRDAAPQRSRWRCMRCLNVECGTTSLHAVLADHHIL